MNFNQQTLLQLQSVKVRYQTTSKYLSLTAQNSIYASLSETSSISQNTERGLH